MYFTGFMYGWGKISDYLTIGLRVCVYLINDTIYKLIMIIHYRLIPLYVVLLQTFEDYIDRINLILMTKSTTVDKLMHKIAKFQRLQNATE